MHTTDDAPDFDAMRLLALRRIQALTRDEALGLAVHHSVRRVKGDDQKGRLEWVRKAQKAGSLQAQCLGWFDLENPHDPDLPWPAISFYVRAGDRMASLSLYLSPQGAWEVADDDLSPRADGTRRPGVDWDRYRGNPAGPWNAINGDEPVSRERPAAAPSAPPPSDTRTPVPPTPEPTTSRTSKRTAGTSSVRPRSTRKAAEVIVPAKAAPSVREEIVLRLLRLLQGE